MGSPLTIYEWLFTKQRRAAPPASTTIHFPCHGAENALQLLTDFTRFPPARLHRCLHPGLHAGAPPPARPCNPATLAKPRHLDYDTTIFGRAPSFLRVFATSRDRSPSLPGRPAAA